jgi:acid phosphatase (class A)
MKIAHRSISTHATSTPGLSLRSRLNPGSTVAWCVSMVVLLLVAQSPLPAADSQLHYLPPGSPDASVLLAPPPALGSPEQAADLDEVRSVHRAAGANDIAAAFAEKSFTIFNFAPEVGSFFTPANLPKTAAFFDNLQSDAALVTDHGKEHFKRPRPFVTDPSLASGKLEKSSSYPSGHSTESMVVALVLADILTDKREAILNRARTIGWHRVQIARHYPTDIHAGRTLAYAIVNELRKNEAFKKEFDAVKSEIEAARKSP